MDISDKSAMTLSSFTPYIAPNHSTDINMKLYLLMLIITKDKLQQRPPADSLFS